MLTKIFIHNQGYEVNLLNAEEVVQDIKENFIGADASKELNKHNKLDNVILQYLDNYEKVEYQNNSYFVLKSRIPLEFKQKSFTKKFISSDEMTGRFFGSLALPVMFIATNVYDTVRNVANMLSSSVGTTKINGKLRDSESAILCLGVVVINILFWVWYGFTVNKTTPFWTIFIVQFINMLLGVLKPISYHYNQMENYKLASYTFDNKYEVMSGNPIERLNAMKSTPDKKKIEFDFTEEENKSKEKEKTYATY